MQKKFTKESNLQKLMMARLSELGATVWRNNTGVLKNERGVPIRFGLCVGSSDIIGIAPDGRFLAVECKNRTGKATPEQERFIRHVLSRGGIAGICRSVEDVEHLLSSY